MWSKVTMADGRVLSKERHVAQLQQVCLSNYAILCTMPCVRRLACAY